MNERRWAGARFNRNGKRSKSWQIFTFEVYKNPVFRSSLSRIFYNVVRIVIFCLIVSPSFFFFFFFLELYKNWREMSKRNENEILDWSGMVGRFF